jgi:hypothetical protein
MTPVHTHSSYLFKTNFNMIFSSTPMSSKWSVSFRVLYHNLYIFLFFNHMHATCQVDLIFHIAVQQPLKPLWSRLLLCDHEPSQTSTVLCFMSLLMSLLPASGEFVSEFPSPRVILILIPSSLTLPAWVALPGA